MPMPSLRRVQGIVLCMLLALLFQLVAIRRDLSAWTNDSWKETAEVVSFLGLSVGGSDSSTPSKGVIFDKPKRQIMMRQKMRNRRDEKQGEEIAQQPEPSSATIPDDEGPLASHSYNISGPIFILSLPKSGTTSVSKFFKCGGLRAPHTYGNRVQGRKSFRLGTCMKKNFGTDRPLLTGCRPDFYHAYSDIGQISPSGCFYPSIQALDQIARDYPNATLVVSYRDGWYEAAQKWMEGGLVERWTSYCPVFPNSTDATEWQAFYDGHRQRIRQTVEAHPTLNYLEFNLTHPSAGQQLANFTGIDERCWRNCKPNKPCPKPKIQSL